MTKSVLSIEQMQNLINNGVDVSRASWQWMKFLSPNADETKREYWCVCDNDIPKVKSADYYPCYDLTDILELLPKKIVVDYDFSEMGIEKDKYTSTYYLQINSYKRSNGTIQWCMIYDNRNRRKVGTPDYLKPYQSPFDNDLLQLAYRMLRYCIDNEYIKTNNN